MQTRKNIKILKVKNIQEDKQISLQIKSLLRPKYLRVKKMNYF
jgi:ribosomal protein L20A (L18A)